MPINEQKEHNQLGDAGAEAGGDGMTLPSFDFASLPQFMQEEVVKHLAFPTWFAFMQVSKQSLSKAFNQNIAYQRIISVLLDLTLLDGVSLELLLAYFRVSSTYHSLLQKIQTQPESVSVEEWIVIIHSATSIEQICMLSKIDGFYASVKKLVDSLNVRSDFKELAVATQLYMLSNRDPISENFSDYFQHALHLARLTQLTQPLPEEDQLEKIVSTLEILPHDQEIAESIDVMRGILSIGLVFMNGLLSHDTPLPRLMLMGLDAHSRNLSQLDFCFANLQAANFSDGLLYEMLCRHANFRNANLSMSYLGNADFYAADLRQANLEKVFFMLGNLNCANLSGACMQRAYFGAANMSKAIIIAANLNHADLSLANLAGAKFSFSNMENVRFIRVEMPNAILRGVKMMGAVLENVNMTQVDLTGANLTGANLKEVDLRGARLVDVNLKDVKMVKVILTGAKVLGMKCDYLLDIDLLRARLDVVHRYMQDGIVPANIHGRFRNCATQELVAFVESQEDISAQIRMQSLEAVIHHPIFANVKLQKIEKTFNHSIGLFASHQIAIRSDNQQVIADCIVRLQADLVIRPEY